MVTKHKFKNLFSSSNLNKKWKSWIFGKHYYHCAIKNLYMKIENRCYGNKLKIKENYNIIRYL